MYSVQGVELLLQRVWGEAQFSDQTLRSQGLLLKDQGSELSRQEIPFHIFSASRSGPQLQLSRPPSPKTLGRSHFPKRYKNSKE